MPKLREDREYTKENKEYVKYLAVLSIAILIIVIGIFVIYFFQPKFDEQYAKSLLEKNDPDVMKYNFTMHEISEGLELTSLKVNDNLTMMQEVRILINKSSNKFITAEIERFSLLNETLNIVPNKKYLCANDTYMNISIGKLQDGTSYIGGITNNIPMELFFKNETPVPLYFGLDESNTSIILYYLKKFARLSKIAYYNPDVAVDYESEYANNTKILQDLNCTEVAI